MKLFNLYESEELIVEDISLKPHLNIEPKMILKTHGRNRERFSKDKVNVIERIINLIGVPGHRGKKHRIQTNWASGKYEKNTNILLKTFEIIQTKTKSNPVQVLIKAIENSSPCDEVTAVEYGGARYPVAVDVSPTRRITISLRNIVHGGYDKAFNKKKRIHEGLAEEIISAYENSNESFAVSKRNEVERQANSAR
jgi:small subunit ribosomal protein S7